MSRRTVVRAAMVVALVAGVAVGMVWDWFNWHPMSALVLTLVAVPVVVMGIVLALFRRARVVGVTVLALGIGLIAGQVLGPARPQLAGADGTLAMTVDRPVAAEGIGVATCQWSPTGDELQVSGDSNLRVDLLPTMPDAPPDVDQRAVLAVSITVGDRWSDGTVARSDNVDLWMSVGSVRDGAQEVRLAASDESTVDLRWTPEGGSLHFAGLVDAATGVPVGPPLAGLAGTFTWTCRARVVGVTTGG